MHRPLRSAAALREVTIVLLAALTLALMPACGKSKKTETAIQTKDLANYKKMSCEFRPNEGGSAPQVAASSEQLSVTYFDKRYPRAHLEAIMNISGTETIRYMNVTGVNVYKAPSKISECSPLGSLGSAPTDVQRYWDSEIKKNKDGTIIALYLEHNNSHAPSATKDKAVVIVREDAHRWVLVHEYMHHLFHSQTEKEGSSDAEMLSKLDQSNSALKRAEKTYNSNPSTQTWDAYASIIEEFIETYDQVLVRYTLEEMTIETLLIDEFKAGNLKNVSELQIRSGVGYILNSGESAGEEYSSWIKVLDKLSEVTHASRSSSMITKLRALINQRIDLINELRSKASATSSTLSLTMDPMAYNPEEAATGYSFGCSQNDVLLDLKNRTKRYSF